MAHDEQRMLLYLKRKLICHFLFLLLCFCSENNHSLSFFKKMGHSRPLFLYFCLFNTVDSEYMNKNLPMTGFKPRTSGVGSNRSTHWATTTATYFVITVRLNSFLTVVDWRNKVNLLLIQHKKYQLYPNKKNKRSAIQWSLVSLIFDYYLTRSDRLVKMFH